MKLVIKPDWWPKNPYPVSIFPMPEEQYPEIVPDPELRTALSGMLGRRFWNIASEAIWAAMIEEDAEALEWCRLHENEGEIADDIPDTRGNIHLKNNDVWGIGQYSIGARWTLECCNCGSKHQFELVAGRPASEECKVTEEYQIIITEGAEGHRGGV